MDENELPVRDGLITPEVRPWSRDKHRFLGRYIYAFVRAMRHQWELHYIDLFAGAGIEDVEGCGLDWGSPLLAARNAHRFDRLHLCEKHPEKFSALEQRISRFDQPSQPQIFNRDANEIVGEVIDEIPTRRSLGLAFLDPYGLHLDLQTVKALSSRRIDLIIFFPDHLDALRNWRVVYQDQPDSNLDQVLGTNEWRSVFEDYPPDSWAEQLTRLYERQLRSIGFKHFDYERITRENGAPLYRLIFCSKSKFGADLWTRVALNRPDGQQSFDFTD